MAGRFSLLVFWLAVSSLTAVSAKGIVEGMVFDGATLAPVPGSTVTVFDLSTGGAVARMAVNNSGNYDFALPAGTYSIAASRIVRGVAETDEVNVTIRDNSTTRIDLVLFAALPAVEEPAIPPALNISKQQLAPTSPVPQPFLAIAAALAALIVAGLFYKYVLAPSRHYRKEEERAEPHVAVRPKPTAPLLFTALSSDLEQALQTIKQNEGRMTQKELRKALNVSEAKASLLATELEERGIIVKIKKGRGNVLKLP